VLHALAAPEDERVRRRGLFEEELDGSRLPDPSLARHEDDAASSAERRLERGAQHLEGLVAPDDGGAPGVALRHRARRDGGDESIPAVLARDEAGRPRVVAKDGAEVFDVVLDRGAVDDVRWPHRPQDLFLRDGSGATLEEHRQHPLGILNDVEIDPSLGQRDPPGQTEGSRSRASLRFYRQPAPFYPILPVRTLCPTTAPRTFRVMSTPTNSDARQNGNRRYHPRVDSVILSVHRAFVVHFANHPVPYGTAGSSTSPRAGRPPSLHPPSCWLFSIPYRRSTRRPPTNHPADSRGAVAGTLHNPWRRRTPCLRSTNSFVCASVC
jgi:hypothetical protein